MMNKEEVLEKYFFNKVKPKFLRYFEDQTPSKNLIKGWICTQPGEFLSSIFLEEIEVDGKIIPQNRFLRGMPKQHYYNEETWDLYQEKDFTLYHCYEKIDGTCLMLYALYDSDENFIEIVPRTRGTAVAGDHIIEMYNKIDQAQIKDFYSYSYNWDYVLMFELYGILNQHEIPYYKSYIDIKFIGATLDREVLGIHDIMKISYDHYFTMPYRLFTLCSHKNKWRIWGENSPFFPYYADKKLIEDKTYNSLGDCINALIDLMEVINDNYKKENGHYGFEGVVINGLDEKENQRYVKIKPKTIFEKAKMANGIPNSAIRKEIYKYFDENGLKKVEYIYKTDPLYHLKFVRTLLVDNFPSEYVFDVKTTKKIDNLFFEIWKLKTPSENVQKAVSELLQKYPNENIIDIMRYFSKEYPFLKRESRQVYSILKQIKG